MYYRMSPAQTADLGNASELTLYFGGYGVSNRWRLRITILCCVVQRRYFARAGRAGKVFLQRCSRTVLTLAMRLAGAEPLLDNPVTITHIPYGYTAAQPRRVSTVSAIRQPLFLLYR